MKKIFIILFFICQTYVFSQRSELGFTTGVSYYLGDLNPSKQFIQVHPAIGLIFRYNLNSRFAYKTSLLYCTVEGSDAASGYNPERNLSFKSEIFEYTNQIELNFMTYAPGNMDYPFSPYIFGGLSLFHFNPKAQINGNWYNLQPLGTEGQGTSKYPDKTPYSLVSFAIPFGIGFKLNINKNIAIGAEWGIRKTFTDYLDDVSTTYADPNVIKSENSPIAAKLADRSNTTNTRTNIGLQRGNSKNNDWYSYAGLNITMKIKQSNSLCPAYQKDFNYKEFKLFH